MFLASLTRSEVAFWGNSKVVGVTTAFSEAFPAKDFTLMALSHTAIQTAKPKEKPYKLYDEKGLFILVTPNGG